MLRLLIAQGFFLAAVALRAAPPALPFKISGYGQLQWENLPGANTFRARRVRLTLAGVVNPLIAYKVQGDFTRNPALLDAVVVVRPERYAQFTIGQGKIPFGESNVWPTANLIMVERAPMYDLEPGVTGRDIGVKASGTYSFSKSTGIYYSAGVFNGAGINKADNNNHKDFSARVVLHPLPAFSFGGSVYRGAAGPTLVPLNRQDAEMRASYGPVLVMSEIIWGVDGPIHKDGWYTEGYWQLAKRWQAAGRVDAYNSNRALAGNKLTDFLAGVNWVPERHLRFQLNGGAQRLHAAWRSLWLSQLEFRF